MDTWLPFGRMPREGNHLAGPGRLAGRQSSLHVLWFYLLGAIVSIETVDNLGILLATLHLRVGQNSHLFEP